MGIVGCFWQSVRLLCVGALVIASGAVAACAQGDGLRVGLAYDVGGRGDKSFNDAAAAGMDRVRAELAGQVSQVRELAARDHESDEDRYDRLKLLCEADFDVVIAVGVDYAGLDPRTGPLARAAADCPQTRFAIVDDARVRAPNVTGLVFADEQGSYLVGAAAGWTTGSGRVGFVGACRTPLIGRFEAGFRAGVAVTRPGGGTAPTGTDAVDLRVRYLAGDERPCPGYAAPEEAERVAGELYDDGADIVYHAAGGSGMGVFRAARERGRLAIGVDSDQYVTVGPPLNQVILTSMVKRVDIAVFEFVRTVARGGFTAGERRFDLAGGGVGYATSGGQIDALVPRLSELRRKIVDGTIRVPVTP